MLTQSQLKECLHYNPDTGDFTWIKPLANRMHAGDIAGAKDKSGYIYIKFNSKKYSGHRLAWFYIHGEFPGCDIDHINLKRNDNRIKNLRKASRSENLQNTVLRKDNTSGVKGVSWCSLTKRWLARCGVNGTRYQLGRYDSIEGAINAVMEFREEHHGEFANHGGKS